MARLRLLPHREASEEAVVWGPWWARLNGKRIPVDERLEGWDYATPVSFELQPSIDTEQLLSSTGLPDVKLCDVVLLVECSYTTQRFLARRNLKELVDASTNVIEVQTDSAEIARAVRLSAHIVLNTHLPKSGSTAYRQASRLAQSPATTVWLEGDAPRFPTEALPFSALKLEPALWDLTLSFVDLDDAFLSGVRLLVNTEHPAADMLLDEEHPHFQLAQSALKVDICRQLVAYVARDPGLTEAVARHGWSEGSVGATLSAMTETFLGSDLASCIEMYRQDPRRFERRLQDGFDLFRDIG